MQRQDTLLLQTLCWNELHVRPGCCRAECRRIGRVVLLALFDKRFHRFGRDQLHLVSKPGQYASPMMGRAARLQDAWNQSRIGRPVTPASARMARRPGQPSVKAVSSVSPVRPTVSRVRRINAAMSVPLLVTAPNTCRPPSDVSALPTRTSRYRSPSWQLRMNVESKLRVIADAGGGTGLIVAASPGRSPALSVWPRRVSWLVPAATGRRWPSPPGATR